MKIRDLFQGCNQAFRNSEPTFQTRLLYAELSSPYDVYADSKWGYIDGARECLEGYKPIEELEEYVKQYEIDNSPLDEYDLSYCLAIKDFIKQEEKKNEGSLERYKRL
jgi:hypothetical protein|nr:MAG TPA: hypothetical protein [Caudoviricetes sp.]